MSRKYDEGQCRCGSLMFCASEVPVTHATTPSQTPRKRKNDGAWPCACMHPRVAHTDEGCGVCLDCETYDSAPCLRGSDGCEIPGRHDMCGLVLS